VAIGLEKFENPCLGQLDAVGRRSEHKAQLMTEVTVTNYKTLRQIIDTVFLRYYMRNHLNAWYDKL
jgi:hypothetical protein